MTDYCADAAQMLRIMDMHLIGVRMLSRVIKSNE